MKKKCLKVFVFFSNIIMGGGGSNEVHHYHTNTVYQTPVEVQKELDEKTDQLKKFSEVKTMIINFTMQKICISVLFCLIMILR